MGAKIALVTGGSSGIGKRTAESLIIAGYDVTELSRHQNGGTVPHISADVTDEGSVIRAVEQLIADKGSIDLVVNCAGFGISGAIEFTDTAEAKALFDVNFFGMVCVNRAVLPHMRARGSGRIINISSVAAPVPIPFQAYYSASKAAVNSYTCALANEVRPYGIGVCALMPGDIRTGFTAARKKISLGDEEYGGRISRSVARMEKDELEGMEPQAVADRIVAIAIKGRIKPLYSLGLGYKAACLAARLLPCGPLNRLIYQIYAK